MDIQTEVQKIHHQFGVTEKANYEIQKLFDKAIKEAVTEALRKHAVIGSFSMHDLMLYYQDAENFYFNSKAIDVLNSMVNDR